MTITNEIANANPDDYAIILTGANYVGCRLREIPPMGSLGSVEELSTAPAVQFIAKAMQNKSVVKGFLCHALWLLTPMPELIKDRNVICHIVVLADIANAGGTFVPDESHVVVDDDMVTGRSAADIDKFCKMILKTYKEIGNRDSKVCKCSDGVNAKNKKAPSIAEIIQDAIGPEVWMKHLTDDLLKFWDTEEAKTFEQGLFPTFRSNDGTILPIDSEEWSPEYKAAKADPTTSGLVDPQYNYVRAHSRQTYAYGIAYHMTGELKYLELCRKGTLSLIEVMDGNYGMFVKVNRTTGDGDSDRLLRISQDLSYGLLGIGMYYFLTHDKGVLHKIIQIKDYIFDTYMDDAKGYLTWYPKVNKDPEVQIVAQLDQLYAYMLMLTPTLPEPYKGIWKKDMKKICDILITQFYSENYDFFWGVESDSSSMSLGTDHTDFGHSIKTFWVIQKVGELLGDPFYIEFARPKIDAILKSAYIEKDGTWARRFDENGAIDNDKEWWICAELDQVAEILSIHDPIYYKYLNTTQPFWLEVMVDHEYGEIWHMLSGKDNKPMLQYPKVHNWKTSLHSFEHVLFSYMTASRIKGQAFDVYYALPRNEVISKQNVAPYMFFASIEDVTYETNIGFMPDDNSKIRVKYNQLH